MARAKRRAVFLLKQEAVVGWLAVKGNRTVVQQIIESWPEDVRGQRFKVKMVSSRSRRERERSGGRDAEGGVMLSVSRASEEWMQDGCVVVLPVGERGGERVWTHGVDGKAEGMRRTDEGAYECGSCVRGKDAE